MKDLIAVCICFLLSPAYADVAVVNGQPFDLVPSKVKDCGPAGSPEHRADVAILSFSIGNGKSAAKALCAAGESKFCNSDTQSRFALALLFKTIRTYPSQFRSSGCKDLRAECASFCSIEKVLSNEECVIECNQYESWNR